jgi:integrase
VVQKRNRALILLLLSTGARSSEVLRLDRSEWKSERWWVLGEGDGERIVEVAETRSGPRSRTTSTPVDHSPALFIGLREQGRQLQPVHHRRCAACVPPVRVAAARHADVYPHQLRHTLGTLLQETMGDARFTVGILGSPRPGVSGV